MFTSPQGLALVGVVAAGVLGTAGSARGDAAAASALFDEGKALFAAGRYREARDKLEASYEMSPLSGTAGLLAACHERTGQLASAWARYGDSAVLAERSGNRERAAIARAKAAELEPRLARLEIDLSGPARRVTTDGGGTVVMHDGERVPNAALGVGIPVDAGRHVVVATAPGRRRWTRTLEIRDGQRRTVVIPELGAITVASPRRAAGVWAGLGLLGIGGAAVIAGGAFGISARSGWSDARAAGCTSNGVCPDQRSGDLAETAGRRADLATGLIAGGLAVAATGLFVYWKAPGRRDEGGRSAGVSAALDGERFTIALEGRF